MKPDTSAPGAVKAELPLARCSARATGDTGSRLNLAERLAIRRGLLLRRGREYLECDSFLFRKLAAFGGLLAGFLLRACGSRQKAFQLWSAVHRRNYSALADRVIEERFRPRHGKAQDSTRGVYHDHVERLAPIPGTLRFLENPCRLLGTRVLVIKSPGPNEKGVLLIDNSAVFPVVARTFDLGQISRRYHFVLEPSWSGFCDLDILCYAQFDFPVFVEAYEPRDAAFLETIGSNLIPVPTAANWWVDHRLFSPLPNAVKDTDVIMVASWAKFKRHDRLLEALARLRAGGRRLKTILVGYPVDFSLDRIYRLVKYYDLADQVELFEGLPARDVNALLNRARVNVLWSRREGINRAIIEGMFAGVPCLVRAGFNYGYRYPYINPQTGCFTGEKELPDRLLWMVRNHEQFSPRDWVMANLTCQQATAILGEAIRNRASLEGECWTRGLAVKVAHLHTMCYWDEDDRKRFEPDYAFLRSALRTEGKA
jgi:glycosyltransferase involved in cell wall biosynthesis